MTHKKLPRVHVRANASSKHRSEKWRGREHIVVPVVMLMETVVNGAFVPLSELKAEAWNGVPVTLSHPVSKDGKPITANSPETLDGWQVGTIFNTKIEDGKLKAEAWIDVALAKALSPALLKALKSGRPMDVSTGYFPTVTRKKGTHAGKPYVEIHKELKPDHLALLPDEEGACNWSDGCGVRTNKRNAKMAGRKISTIIAALLGGKKPAANEDAHEALVEEIIEAEASPFTEDHREALDELDDELLAEIRDEVTGNPDDNADEEDEEDEDKKPAANKGRCKGAGKGLLAMNAEDLAKLIDNSVSKTVEAALKANREESSRKELVAKIVANKSLGFSAQDLEGVPLKTLSRLAAKAPGARPNKPTANYAGRNFANRPDDSGNPGKYAAMATHGKAPEKKDNK